MPKDACIVSPVRHGQQLNLLKEEFGKIGRFEKGQKTKSENGIRAFTQLETWTAADSEDSLSLSLSLGGP